MAASRTAAAAVGKTGLSYQSILCNSVVSLASLLKPKARVAALDITPTHVSISVSDRDRKRAAPFGVLARSGSMSIDARSIARAFSHANSLDPSGSLDVQGLVVGVPPGGPTPFDFVDGLLLHGGDDKLIHPPFPDVEAVLFYCEAAALKRTISALHDNIRALELLPDNLETRKFNRFLTALRPKPTAEEIQAGRISGARISASEILQVVLDEMAVPESGVNDGE